MTSFLNGSNDIFVDQKNKIFDLLIKESILFHQQKLDCLMTKSKFVCGCQRSNHKEQLFIKFVIRYLETMNEYCLECDSKNIKELINKIKSIFSLDHVMRRKYKQLYEKIMEIKITEQRLFSKERLEGKKGEEFLQSVKQYLFRNGNNEYMNFDIYYKMIEEMKQ